MALVHVLAMSDAQWTGSLSPIVCLPWPNPNSPVGIYFYPVLETENILTSPASFRGFSSADTLEPGLPFSIHHRLT